MNKILFYNMILLSLYMVGFFVLLLIDSPLTMFYGFFGGVTGHIFALSCYNSLR